MKKIIINIAIFLLAANFSLSQIQGKLEVKSFIGPVTKNPVNFSIYLPKDYNKNSFAYPVVYHLHGLGDHHQSSIREMVIESFERAVSLGFIKDLIIVFPDGYNNSAWADSFNGAKPAETNFIKELIPYIDAHYRTIPDRENRFIQGFSMGAFGAAKFIAKNPEMFCRSVLYDGGMRTWRSLRRGRPQIASEIFNQDEKYFYDNSVWKELANHSDLLSLDTAFRVVIGEFTDMNQIFIDSLEYYKIPYQRVDTPCGHDLLCLLEREWINTADYFNECLSTATTDVFARQFVPSKLSISLNPVSDILSIIYNISRIGSVKVEIINLLGSTIYVAADSYQLTGQYRVDINIRRANIAKGTYFVCLSSDNRKVITRPIVIK